MITGKPCIDFLDNLENWNASCSLTFILLSVQVSYPVFSFCKLQTLNIIYDTNNVCGAINMSVDILCINLVLYFELHVSTYLFNSFVSYTYIDHKEAVE